MLMNLRIYYINVFPRLEAFYYRETDILSPLQLLQFQRVNGKSVLLCFHSKDNIRITFPFTCYIQKSFQSNVACVCGYVREHSRKNFIFKQNIRHETIYANFICEMCASGVFYAVDHNFYFYVWVRWREILCKLKFLWYFVVLPRLLATISLRSFSISSSTSRFYSSLCGKNT